MGPCIQGTVLCTMENHILQKLPERLGVYAREPKPLAWCVGMSCPVAKAELASGEGPQNSGALKANYGQLHRVLKALLWASTGMFWAAFESCEVRRLGSYDSGLSKFKSKRLGIRRRP